MTAALRSAGPGVTIVDVVMPAGDDAPYRRAGRGRPRRPGRRSGGGGSRLQPRGSPPRRRLAGNPRPRGECRGRDQPLRRLPRAGDRAAHLHQCRRSLSYRRSDTGEERAPTPFIAYGRTKLLAEQVHRAWASPEAPGRRSLLIVRPAVVFGEGNRGNVSQLLRQIASGRSMMVASHNRKSMAYVGNVSAFQVHALGPGSGAYLFNYATSPTSRCWNWWTPYCRPSTDQRSPGLGLRRLPRGCGMRPGRRPHPQARPH